MEKENPESSEKNRRYIWQFLISFALFDIIHLVCATALVIIAFNERPIDIVDAGEAFIEIVFALLLISFINAMQHHHRSIDHPQVTFTLGCLTASASLFVPLTLFIPEVVDADWSVPHPWLLVMMTVTISLSALCFALFFIALRFSKKPRAWRIFIVLGLAVMVSLGPIEFAFDFYNGATGMVLVFRAIKSIAPIVFAPTGILLVLRRKSSESLFFETK